MAIVYVDNTATGLADGTSWADAYTTLLEATGVAVTEDVIYISHTHTEQPTASTTYTISGNNVSIYSVNKIGNIYTKGATIDNDASIYDISFSNTSASNFKIIGVSFYAGDDYFFTTNLSATFTDCDFYSSSTNPSYTFTSVDLALQFNNSSFRGTGISSTGGALMHFTEGLIEFNNHTFVNTSVNQELLDLGSGDTVLINFNNCDMSGIALSTNYLIAYSLDGAKTVNFKGCILPPSMTGVSATPTHTGHIEVEFISCTKPDYMGAADDDSAYWYYNKIDWVMGEVSYNINVFLGSTYDGSTGFSSLLAGSLCSVSQPLRHKLIEIPSQDLTAPKTITVNTVTDNVILTDTEFWIEVEYPDNTNQVLGTLVSSREADILAAGASLTTNTEAWTTTGLTTPIKQQASVTIPTLSNVTNGNVVIYVNLSKASTNVYVDPKTTIS